MSGSGDAAGVAAGAVEARVVRVLGGARAVAAGRGGDGVRLEVRLERGGQRQPLQPVHRCARHYRPAAQLLQAEDCRTNTDI